MTIEEYVDRYKLGESFHFDRSSFIIDFMKDVDETLATKVNADGFVKYNDFQQAVSAAKVCWDVIFKNTAVSESHADKFWGFVYATEIIPRRNRLVPRTSHKMGRLDVEEDL
jgi:hypothetical protein